MKKQNWIYELRGMAIIAVVVCHHQHVLHESEWVQMLTLYSVTAFIFCAGLTQSISLERIDINVNKKNQIINWLLEHLKPVLTAYVVASAAYLTLKQAWTGNEISILWDNLLAFSASPPLYFMRYYICLTLVSPILYFGIVCLKTISNKKLQMISEILYLTVIFILGYLSIGKLDLLGQSYLFVYTAGMMLKDKMVYYNENKNLPWKILLGGGGLCYCRACIM